MSKIRKDIPEGRCFPLPSSHGLQPPASLGSWPLEPLLEQRDQASSDGWVSAGSQPSLREKHAILLNQKIKFSQKQTTNKHTHKQLTYHERAQLIKPPRLSHLQQGHISAPPLVLGRSCLLQPNYCPLGLGSAGAGHLPSHAGKYSPCQNEAWLYFEILDSGSSAQGSVPVRTEEGLFLCSRAEVPQIPGEVSGMLISCFCSAFLLQGLI